MISAVSINGTYEELEAYAMRVSDGYRPPIHDTWPPSIYSLIEVGFRVWGGLEWGCGLEIPPGLGDWGGKGSKGELSEWPGGQRGGGEQ